MNNPKEIDFNNQYLIYDDGRVFSKFRNRFLKPALVRGNYYVSISGLSSHRRIALTKLVYHHFVEKIDLKDDSYVILTKDGNRLNTTKNNLYLLSRNEFIRSKSVVPGTGGTYKLPGLDSRIYDMYTNDLIPVKKLAITFNCSEMTIRRSIKRHIST